MGNESSSGPTIGPAMPFPPSSTTFIARRRSGSMKPSAARLNSSPTSSRLIEPGSATGSPGPPAETMSRSSPIPASPESAIAPRRTSLAPVYPFGLCEAVHIRPPSSRREPTVQ
jgi:hypothetical protein